MTPGVSPPSATSDTVLPSVSADTDGSTAHTCSPAACHPRGRSASRWRRRSDRRQAHQRQGPAGSQPVTVCSFPGPWFPQDPRSVGGGVLGGRGGHLEASCGPPTPDIRAPCPAQPCPSRCPSPGSPSQLPLTRPGQALGPSDWRPGGQEGPWMPATRCCGAQREKRPGVGGMPEAGGPGTAHPPPKPGSEVRAAPQWSAHGLWGQDLGRAHMPRGYPEGSDRMPAGW